MKKNSKTVVSVDVEMLKTAYKRQGKGRTPRGER